MVRHKYKNPPIEEALCEFTFAPTSNPDAHFLTLPGKLHSLLKADYPGEIQQQRMQTVNSSGPANTDIQFQDELFRIQFPSADGTRLVSIGQNALSVSMMKPYSEWEADFFPRIKTALRAYLEITGPLKITRVGIRYINRISLPTSGSPFVMEVPEEEALSAKLSSFTKRFEFALPNDFLLILTQATLVSTKRPEYLLDLDVIWNKTVLQNFDDVIAKVDELHKREGDVFEALLTEEARKQFDV